MARLAFLTCPSPDVYLLNLRVEGEDFYRLEISRAQLANMVVDGAAIALRLAQTSPRLGPESFAPPVPDIETIDVVRAAVDLKDKGE
jgi:hypothetical protein